MADQRSRALVEKVLGDPSLYPQALSSWLQRYLSGNDLVTFTQSQLPSLEQIRLIGATGNPVFLSTTGNFGGSSQAVGFYRSPEGIVHLCGAAVWSALGAVGFALPSGYRPLAVESFAVYTNTGVGRIDVDENGNVTLQAGGLAFVSLSGITYRAA